MESSDFKDFKEFSKNVVNLDVDSTGRRIKWREIRVMHFESHFQNTCTIQYDYGGEYHFLHLIPKKLRHHSVTFVELQTLYHDGGATKLSKVKFADLLKLCNKNVIPGSYREFYESLPHEDNQRTVVKCG